MRRISELGEPRELSLDLTLCVGHEIELTNHLRIAPELFEAALEVIRDNRLEAQYADRANVLLAAAREEEASH